MKKAILTLCVLAAFFVAASVGSAQLTGPEILTKVDQVMNAPKDQTYKATTIMTDSAGNVKTRTSQMMQKGKDLRLIRFLDPPNERGISFLVLEDETMYLYLPEFHKVRRIASHVKNEPFMGTDFSYDDISLTEFSKWYDATLESETDAHYVLKLVPKPEEDKDYSKLMMWVIKTNFCVEKVEFYDKKQELFKVEEMRGYRKIGEYWAPKEMEMKNLKDNHSTKMVLQSQEYDKDIPDSTFTERNLKRVR